VRQLEWTARQGRQFGYKAIVSWFYGWWSEALRLTGAAVRARDVALEGLELASQGQGLYGAGFGRRALGRLAQDAGDHAEADNRGPRPDARPGSPGDLRCVARADLCAPR